MTARKPLALIAALATTAATLVACGGGGAADDEASVYFLNFKPEVDQVYQDIAAAYTEETGVPVKVVTAASGTYEQTLKAEVGKSDAPTIFQVNGPTGLKTWSDYAGDMSGTDIAANLNPDVPALQNADGATVGIPIAVEGYGIIYNQDIFNRYFALPGAVATSMEEINSFDMLKQVADDMQAKKAELGIDGAFASTSLATGEDWRWQTHLASMPIYQELEDAGETDAQEVEFTYNPEYKQLFDLYVNDSTVEPSLTPSKTVTDSMAEFAMGKAAMVQNGNWAWSQIADVAGNVVQAENVKFMPMYMGLPGESEHGIAVGTENYITVNSQASEVDQQASKDFLDWLYTSDAGKQFVVNDLGFIAPFSNFTEDETPSDPLAQQVTAAMQDDTVTTYPWTFQIFPSQQFKDDFGQSLAQYVSGNMNWDEVVTAFIDSWKAEKEATA